VNIQTSAYGLTRLDAQLLAQQCECLMCKGLGTLVHDAHGFAAKRQHLNNNI